MLQLVGESVVGEGLVAGASMDLSECALLQQAIWSQQTPKDAPIHLKALEELLIEVLIGIVMLQRLLQADRVPLMAWHALAEHVNETNRRMESTHDEMIGVHSLIKRPVWRVVCGLRYPLCHAHTIRLTHALVLALITMMSC